MQIGMTLKGFKQYDKFLEQLPAQTLRKAARGAIRASAKPITKQMRANLKGHRRTGNLSKSIVVQNTKERRFEIAVYIGFKTGKGGGNHAALVEFGTSPRVLTGSKNPADAGTPTGAMPALRFFVRARKSKRSEQVALLKTELKKRFEKEVIKLARKRLRK